MLSMYAYWLLKVSGLDNDFLKDASRLLPDLNKTAFHAFFYPDAKLFVFSFIPSFTVIIGYYSIIAVDKRIL